MTDSVSRKSGPITSPAMLVAGPNKDTYSIRMGFKDAESPLDLRGEKRVPAWVMVNETEQSRVGPVDTWEGVYEFFEFYRRSQIYEVIDV